MVQPSFTTFTLIGISHWDAPIEIREKFSLSDSQKRALLEGAGREGLQSLFIISTCNRTEIIAQDMTPHELVRLFVTYSAGTLEEFHKYGFELEGKRAVEHLFKVTTGLDSQILGDLQIVNQVKEGYEFSSRKEMVSGSLHRLMQHVFRAHKRSRHETSLGHGAATVAFAAVKFVARTFDQLMDKRILLVGTGKIGKVTCKNLLSLGASKLTLMNRTRERAEFMADRFNLEVAEMDQLPEQIADADLIIVATGAENPVVTMEHMEPSLGNPKYRVILDLSVPRNVDPDVGKLEFIDVANMDMLSDVTDEAYRRREKEVPLVKQIIREELDAYEIWLNEQRVVPTIKALIDRLHSIRDDEMEFFRNKISEQDVEKVDNLTRRIVNKIAAYSIEHLRDHHDTDDVRRLVEAMFKLEAEKPNE